MKIGGASQIPSNMSVSSGAAIPYRTGDVIPVQVVRIQNISNALSEMILKFPNGEEFNTILHGKFDGQISDVFLLRVQDKTDKQVFAEIVKHQETHSAQKMTISDYLTRLNLPTNNNNYQIMQQMLRNNFPVTLENYKQIADSMKKYQDLKLEQVAFMVKHKIPYNSNSIQMMNTIGDSQNLIGDELLLLFYNIMNKKENRKEFASLLKSFFVNPQGEEFSTNDIKMPTTIKNLIYILDEYVNKMAEGENTLTKLGQFLQKADANFEFMKYFNSDVIYLQIPINLDGFYGTSELYISKEHKNEENNFLERSFFLKIPTLNLGIIEVFVIMDEMKNVQFHFKADSEDEIECIKKHVIKLYDVVKSLKYNVSKVSYNEIPIGIDIQNFELNAALISSKKNLDEKV